MADLASVGAALRDAVDAGKPAAAFIDAWPTLNDEDPAWGALIAEITQAAARLHPSIATAAAIDPEALAFSLVDRFARPIRSGPKFIDWMGDPAGSPDCHRLVRQALADGAAIGLATGCDGRVVTVYARQDATESPWRSLAPFDGVRRDAVLLVVFAPSKSSALVARAAGILGLTPLEARVAEAMLDAPNLAVAADSIGVGRETAKDALQRAMRKAGVRQAAQFVGRMVDLSCAAPPGAADAPLLRQTMGLTAAESRVAVALAEGLTAAEAAKSLGLAEETVRSYRRAVFQKTGVNRSRDLKRLISEVIELDHLASTAQLVPDASPTGERLKIIVTRGRQVAFIDYGPASGEPLVIGHGFSTGRLVPAPFLAALQKAGFRALVPQRPGFGLTDPAEGDYLETAADDLAAVLDSIGARRARILGRDGGVSTYITFAARWPARVDRPVLTNPRTPRNARPPPAAPMSAISRFLLDHPALVEPFAEMLRRQTRSDALEGTLRRACSMLELDRQISADPAVMAQMVRDSQGLLARGVRGFVDEHQVYARDWSPPGLEPRTGPWTIIYSGALAGEPDPRPWAGLPGVRTVMLEGAGVLYAYSHIEQLIALIR